MKTNEKASAVTRIVDGKVERLWFVYENYRHPSDGEPDFDVTWEWRPEPNEAQIAACTVPSDPV